MYDDKDVETKDPTLTVKNEYLITVDRSLSAASYTYAKITKIDANSEMSFAYGYPS